MKKTALIKIITAIVKPEKFSEMKTALTDYGINSITVIDMKKSITIKTRETN